MPPAAPHHVLVVDDAPEIRMLMRITFERQGFRVTEALDGTDALRQLDREIPDIVVSDIMMPEMDGFGLLSAIRADPRFMLLPVIFLTANGHAETEDRARQLGVEHFLEKPINSRRLVATVKGTLARFEQLRTMAHTAPSTADSAPDPGTAADPASASAGNVTPTIAALPAAWDAMPSGIDPLDDLTGGLPRNQAYYVVGDVGCGKTPLAMQFLHWGLARGDGAVFVTMDRPVTVLRLAAEMGLPLDPFLDTNHLALLELAGSLDDLLRRPDDMRAMVAELGAHAKDVGARRLVVMSTLAVLAGSAHIELKSALIGDFLRRLEELEVTTLLVTDPPATPSEQLADAFLRRSAFGSIRLQHEGDGDIRTLSVERLLGWTGDERVRGFRVVHGRGLVGVDVEPDTPVATVPPPQAARPSPRRTTAATSPAPEPRPSLPQTASPATAASVANTPDGPSLGHASEPPPEPSRPSAPASPSPAHRQALLARVVEAFTATTTRCEPVWNRDEAGTSRLSDKWAAAVDRCVLDILATREQCALLVAHVGSADGMMPNVAATLAEIDGPDRVVLGTPSGDIVILSIGSDEPAMERVASHLRERVTATGGGLECAVTAFPDSTVPHHVFRALRELTAKKLSPA